MHRIHLRIFVLILDSELEESESLNRGHFFARSGDRQQASCRSSSQSHNLFKLQWIEINFEVHFVSNKPGLHLLIFWRAGLVRIYSKALRCKIIKKPCSLRFSLHKFVHLYSFLTRFKNVHCQGPCSFRLCILKPITVLISNSTKRQVETLLIKKVQGTAK